MTYLDVGIKGVGPKDGAGPLIPLGLVLLVSCHITRVSVSQPRND